MMHDREHTTCEQHEAAREQHERRTQHEARRAQTHVTTSQQLHVACCPTVHQIQSIPKCACANERQVVIALQGGDILYFEIDDSHTLNEVAKREMNYEVDHFFAFFSVVVVLSWRWRCMAFNSLTNGSVTRGVRKKISQAL